MNSTWSRSAPAPCRVERAEVSKDGPVTAIQTRLGLAAVVSGTTIDVSSELKLPQRMKMPWLYSYSAGARTRPFGGGVAPRICQERIGRSQGASPFGSGLGKSSLMVAR